jgi:hypothetical protein
MKDYRGRGRQALSAQHREALREVALKRVEAGHRRVRAYAVAWGKISAGSAGSSRMSCYRVLKSIACCRPSGSVMICVKRLSSGGSGPTCPRRSTRCYRATLLITSPKTPRSTTSGCVTEYVSLKGTHLKSGGSPCCNWVGTFREIGQSEIFGNVNVEKKHLFSLRDLRPI